MIPILADINFRSCGFSANQFFTRVQFAISAQITQLCEIHGWPNIETLTPCEAIDSLANLGFSEKRLANEYSPIRQVKRTQNCSSPSHSTTCIQVVRSRQLPFWV